MQEPPFLQGLTAHASSNSWSSSTCRRLISWSTWLRSSCLWPVSWPLVLFSRSASLCSAWSSLVSCLSSSSSLASSRSSLSLSLSGAASGSGLSLSLRSEATFAVVISVKNTVNDWIVYYMFHRICQCWGSGSVLFWLEPVSSEKCVCYKDSFQIVNTTVYI